MAGSAGASLPPAAPPAPPACSAARPRASGRRACRPAVTERLVLRAAAPAQQDRFLARLDQVALRVRERHWPVHLVGPVLGGRDLHIGHLNARGNATDRTSAR